MSPAAPAARWLATAPTSTRSPCHPMERSLPAATTTVGSCSGMSPMAASPRRYPATAYRSTRAPSRPTAASSRHRATRRCASGTRPSDTRRSTTRPTRIPCWRWPSSDASLVASGTSQGTVDLWQLSDGALRRSLYAVRGPVWALAFTRDAKTLLSSGSDGVVRLWDVGDGHELSGAVPPLSPAAEAEDRGARLFRKCRACHALTETGETKAGPTPYHLFGRRAGAVAGYAYSPALSGSGLVWSEETVDRLFAEGPEVVAPGSKMPLQKMPDGKDRADLIDFLKRATAQ